MNLQAGEFLVLTESGIEYSLRKQFPDKQFDYVDLAYDVVRDASGKSALLPVPRLNGVGSFSNAKEYFVTNTIRNCDFLIATPVAKCPSTSRNRLSSGTITSSVTLGS